MPYQEAQRTGKSGANPDDDSERWQRFLNEHPDFG
jgi:hypothetical protein